MSYEDKMRDSKQLFQKARDLITAKEEAGEMTPEAHEEIEAIVKMAKEVQATAALYQEIDGELGALERNPTEAVKTYDSGEKPVGPKMSWTEYLKAITVAGHRNPEVNRKRDPRLMWFSDSKDGQSGHMKTLTEGTGTAGGFLVPAEFYAQLQAVRGENSIVRPRASIIRMARRQVDIPVLDQTNTTAGQPAWYGGLVASWTEEAAEKDLTEPSFKKISLVAHKLVLFTRASDELLDDSAISLADLLTGPMGFAGAASWYADHAYLRGTGVGQPLGVINAGCTLPVSRNTPNQVDYRDLVRMYEALLPECMGNAVWVVNQSVMSNLMEIQDPNGNYIWQPNAREGIPSMIFGMPVVWTEKVPTLGTTGDVGLYDFKYYLIGDRQATTVESTQWESWRNDLTSFRCVLRTDGTPWLSTVLTFQDGTTASPFVVLSSTIS